MTGQAGVTKHFKAAFGCGILFVALFEVADVPERALWLAAAIGIVVGLWISVLAHSEAGRDGDV